MLAPDRPRRSVLYLPASNARAIEKARALAADVIVLDLEDAVAPEAKAEARAAAVAAVRAGGFGRREIAIRANGLDTPWGADDLNAIASSGADAVVMPKVSSPADIAACEQALAGAPAGLQLWAMIETCAAVGALFELAALARSTRLSLWMVGTNDLAREMRARLTPDRATFVPILVQAICAARANGLVILDGVCNEFRNIERFRAEAEQGMLLGFDGKTLIHPDQVAPCNTVFSPSPDELARAHAIIDAFAQPENAGKGAIRVDGKMAELLHLEQARRLVDLAGQIATAS
ncbi:MAG TPA: CoA ester lyase [Novosphingobium sp.]|nr:CoA ester lyase [Novosphingobium sp.]